MHVCETRTVCAPKVIKLTRHFFTPAVTPLFATALTFFKLPGTEYYYSQYCYYYCATITILLLFLLPASARTPERKRDDGLLSKSNEVGGPHGRTF